MTLTKTSCMDTVSLKHIYSQDAGLYPVTHISTHIQATNQSNSKLHLVLNICLKSLEIFSHKDQKMRRWKSEVKSSSKSKSLSSFHPFFFICIRLFFPPSFLCCNWLYYEMKVINASLSLAVSVSDWAQQSPNYHRRTHQSWPTIPSHSMQLCLCAHVWGHTHIDFSFEKKKRSPQTTWKCSQLTQLAGVLLIICHNDSGPDTFLINRRTTCLGF